MLNLVLNSIHMIGTGLGLGMMCSVRNTLDGFVRSVQVKRTVVIKLHQVHTIILNAQNIFSCSCHHRKDSKPASRPCRSWCVSYCVDV